jgi:8-oxo-dGTP pyrophosphatase MutT (NUDIX family)
MIRARQAFWPLAQRALHQYWRWARGMTLGVRGLVVNADRKVYLVSHTYVAGWQFPGGGVEPGETLAEALARELVEEANIDILETPVLHGMFYAASESRRDHVALFVVRSFHQTRVPAPNAEIADQGFFSLDALPDSITTHTRARIAEVMFGAPRSDIW